MTSKKPKVTKKKLSDYTQNPKNHNLGTERGAQMLENSLNRYGAGRSVLSDKDGVMIAGNQTLKAALDAGITDVYEIETDGKALVVVKRTDLDLDDPDSTKATEMGYMDNRGHEVSFNLDTQQVTEDIEAGVDMSLMYTPGELDLIVPELDDEDDEEVGGAKTIPDQFICFVECANEKDLAAIFEELQARGYKCRLSLS
jgi:hypothetical protein